jgi:hypothetical protein
MTINMETFRPPYDPCFNKLLESALSGSVPVYGVVLETAEVCVRRFDDGFRPENSIEGQKVLASLMHGWNTGSPIQPWLYVEKGAYLCADDYFFVALLERGRPPTFGAQVLGQPLRKGLVQEIGPLPLAQVRTMVGIKT